MNNICQHKCNMKMKKIKAMYKYIFMDKILQSIYVNSKPKYAKQQFESMINIGLVLTGVKKQLLLS